MGNLDNIPKGDFFKTPDDYFEKLPARIQSRMLTSKRSSRQIFYRYSLQYAVPVVVLALLFLLIIPAGPNAENILATVATEDLVIYLEDSGMSTEDLVDLVQFTPDDIEKLEDAIYTDSYPGVDSATFDLL